MITFALNKDQFFKNKLHLDGRMFWREHEYRSDLILIKPINTETANELIEEGLIPKDAYKRPYRTECKQCGTPFDTEITFETNEVDQMLCNDECFEAYKKYLLEPDDPRPNS